MTLELSSFSASPDSTHLGSFVLVNRAALTNQKIHQSIKGAGLDQPYLQRAYRLVMGSATPVDIVERLLHSNAAVLKELRIKRSTRPCAFVSGLDFPEQHIMTRETGRVDAASVFQEEVISLLQDFLGMGDTAVEILLIGFVRINTEGHISPAYELELGCTVVEACDLKYKPGICKDLNQ